MIVSGYHWPEHTKLGSGIYRGFSDLGYQYTYDENSGDRVILSHVDTCRTSPLTRKPNALSKLEEGEIVQVSASLAVAVVPDLLRMKKTTYEGK